MSDNSNLRDLGSTKATAAGLLGVVREVGGNLSAAARVLSLPRDTVVSRLRRHGLLEDARRARQERRGTNLEELRRALESLSPSERVRVLLPESGARERLLDELSQRGDLDQDARVRLRRARRSTGGAA